ncbi:FkbM family methyltransferase [Cytobacillus praedii]|uniref:FkbM family methyltransferase n=1 Tax=Cytobacillus praedii TaxID=1742358 RepID=UPI003AF833A6
MEKTIFNLPFDQKSFIVYGSQQDRSIFQYIKANGYYENHIINLLKKITDSKSVCLDIGANIGLISLALSYLATEGKVYSFEPSKRNFSYLVQNIKENYVANINPINIGVYDQNKDMEFCNISDGGGWSFVFNGTESITQPNEVVTCVRLDDWVQTEGINKIDLIKIDTEGSEAKVIRGAINTIHNTRPDVIVEFFPEKISENSGDNPEELYNLLESIYPNIYFINRFDDSLVKPADYSHLTELIKPTVYGELYCTFKSV